MAGKTRKQIESEAIARKLKHERKRLKKYYADSRLDTREQAIRVDNSLYDFKKKGW